MTGGLYALWLILKGQIAAKLIFFKCCSNSENKITIYVVLTTRTAHWVLPRAVALLYGVLQNPSKICDGCPQPQKASNTGRSTLEMRLVRKPLVTGPTGLLK